jgi:hypothetical protein
LNGSLPILSMWRGMVSHMYSFLNQQGINHSLEVVFLSKVSNWLHYYATASRFYLGICLQRTYSVADTVAWPSIHASTRHSHPNVSRLKDNMRDSPSRRSSAFFFHSWSYANTCSYKRVVPPPVTVAQDQNLTFRPRERCRWLIRSNPNVNTDDVRNT